jgi:hypothetical protein
MNIVHSKIHHQLPRTQAGTKESGSRLPPSDMSDTELLRFGIRAKYMRSRNGLETWQQQTFSLQLSEARKEWKKRFPKLPLSTTFDERDCQPSTRSQSWSKA